MFRLQLLYVLLMLIPAQQGSAQVPGTGTFAFWGGLYSICDSGTLDTVCYINTPKVVTGDITGSGTLILQNGGSITVTTTTVLAITMNAVAVESGGSINANVTITSNALDIDTGGTISANTKGFNGGVASSGAGQGPGGGTGNGTGGGGGGHGGAGGSYGGTGGAAYGSSTAPVTWGSGGAAAGNALGGKGGGAIRLIISGPMNLDGVISANGAGGGRSGCDGGGGGAGGSIWITATALDGAGTLQANGGNGGSASCGGGTPYSGSGAGGRISIDADVPFRGTIAVNSGFGGYGTGVPVGAEGSFSESWSAGTDSICDTGTLATTCTISSPTPLPSGYTVSGLGNLIIASGGSLYVIPVSTGSYSLNFGGTIEIQAGGQIRAHTITTLEASTELIIRNTGTLTANLPSVTGAAVTLDTGAVISANSMGFAGGTPSNGTGFGPGGGTATSGGGGGGGHGGAGGTYSGVGGGTYGSSTNPVTFGSGGGSPDGYPALGGKGGGALRFNLTGTLTNNGTISVNGGNGTHASCDGGAGGAGGSIWITATTVSGSGSLLAKGGNGAAQNCGAGTPYSGGGGGGRIAIDAGQPYGGTISVSGGNGGYLGPLQMGGEGTFFGNWSGGADAVCDSGTLATTCTISTPKSLPDGYSVSGMGNLIIAGGGALRSLPLSTGTYSVNMAGTIEIQNGGLLEAYSITSLEGSAGLTVRTGGTITANLPSLTGTSVTFESGSIISANDKGFKGGNPPNGTGFGSGGGAATSSGAGGGGHGGIGGTFSGAGGATYGSATNPVSYGSGGGSPDGEAAVGGTGGGAIRINISGAFIMDGTLSVNGSNGNHASCDGGGGGAGGSIWITAASLAGAGSTVAEGGNGAAQNCGSGTPYSGGGGGGRISIEADRPFAGTISVRGGYGGYLNGAHRGSEGTFHSTFSAGVDAICDAGSLSSTCTISSSTVLPTGYTISGPGNLIVAAGGFVHVIPESTGSYSINLTGSLEVQAGGMVKAHTISSLYSALGITVRNTGTINANLPSVTGTILTMDSGSLISADELGFAGGTPTSGSGFGTGGGTATSGGGGGGGHGGNGGTYSGVGGSTYGSAANPVSHGSGGGSPDNYAAHGGSGGGAIRINIAGQVILNGTISVNGGNGVHTSCDGGAGGAGGSIWLTATTLTGSGIVHAKGGNGSAQNCGTGTPYSGGGGGGRISIESDRPFDGTLSVTGGYGGYLNGIHMGSEGSFTSSWTAGSDAICDTGDLSTTCTISTPTPLTDGYGVTGSGNLVIASGGSLYVLPASSGAYAVNMSGTVEVQTGGLMTAQTITSLTATSGLTVQNSGTIDANLPSITGSNVTLDAGSVLTATRKGFAGGTPPNGTGFGSGGGTATNSGGGGGGHGGTGGVYSGGGGGSYGSNTSPITYGSGGGSPDGYPAHGGSGGGAVRINISGTLTLNGTISANGGNGTHSSCDGGGGGAGGSIWITAAAVNGIGSLQALGGNGAAQNCGAGAPYSGGGGGGRISGYGGSYLGAVNVNAGVGGTGAGTGSLLP